MKRKSAVEILKGYHFDEPTFKFMLETQAELLRESLPNMLGLADAVNAIYIESLKLAERQRGPAIVRRALLHDVEEDRRGARREFKGIVEGMRSDISEIETELQRIGPSFGHESNQPLPGMSSGSVDNTPAVNGQKDE